MRAEPFACPCCGYLTMDRAVLERDGEDSCVVCGWEDDPRDAWEVSELNDTTLVEAQHAFLTGTWLPDERDDLRDPRPWESRDPDWRPFDRTPELMARVAQGWVEHERREREREVETEREMARIEERLGRLDRELDDVRTRLSSLDHDELVRRLDGVYRRH